MSNAVVDFGKQLFKQVNEDEVPDLAAGLAYRFLFAIFPFAIFLASLAGFLAPAFGFQDPTNQILGALSDNLPPDVANQIRPQLEEVLDQSRPGLLTIGAVTALWAAASGIGAVIKAMNKAYDVEESRGFVARTGTAIVLTILGSAGILLAFVTIVGGSILTEQLANQLGVGDAVWSTISLLRFPVMLLLVALAVAVLFKFGPNVRVSFRWTLVGGFVYAVIWVLATLAFGIYVANFANYANTYGALGGVVILMLWFYITALMLLVAAEVTSLLAKAKEPERIQARRDEVKAGAGAARKAGYVAGAAVGTVKAAAGGDDAAGDRAAGGAGEHGADRAPEPGARPRREEPARRPPEAIPPVRPPRPAFARPDGERPSGAFAAAVLAAGALAGAVLARITGRDEDAPTR
jgi:membrane protein